MSYLERQDPSRPLPRKRSYGTVTSCTGRVSTKPCGPETFSPYNSRVYGEKDAFQIRRKPAFFLRSIPEAHYLSLTYFSLHLPSTSNIVQLACVPSSKT